MSAASKSQRRSAADHGIAEKEKYRMCSKPSTSIDALLEVFRTAASRVPAYRTLLAENGIRPSDVKTISDFARLPILSKHNTFNRFPIHELCVDGKLGRISWVLTSSGQSGTFSFGLYDPPAAQNYKDRIDVALDAVFGIRSRSTLLLNVLPMGVKLYSEYCTMGETSVRPDMACGLIKAFGRYHEQIILVGETAFIKHLLEMGLRQGIDWKGTLVHAILGEEMVAENARKYVESILDTEPGNLRKGLVGVSMGVAELGLNLFAEVPPTDQIILLRRAMHEDPLFREQILGPGFTTVPAIFAYGTDRIYVEFVNSKLVITMLDVTRTVPMIRYTSDDDGGFLDLNESLRPAVESKRLDYDLLRELPLLFIRGREGHFVKAGDGKVYPEQVKEGIYSDFALAASTTANFRMASGEDAARLRIQLAPGVEPSDKLNRSFTDAIRRYAAHPVVVSCEPYVGVEYNTAVNYEEKFDYFGRR